MVFYRLSFFPFRDKRFVKFTGITLIDDITIQLSHDKLSTKLFTSFYFKHIHVKLFI